MVGLVGLLTLIFWGKPGGCGRWGWLDRRPCFFWQSRCICYGISVSSKHQGVWICLGLLLFGAMIPLRASTVSLHDRVVDDVDRYYLPPADWLRVFSLGYNEAAADFVWIKTIVYFGDIALKDWGRGQQTPVDNFTMNYMRTAAELDPKFRAIYSRGGVLTLYHRGEITEQSVKLAIEVFELGTKQFPNDGEITFHLGFMHYYEMEPFLPRQKNHPTRRHFKERGAYLLSKAALMPNAPQYASVLSSTLLYRLGLNNLVIEHLKALLITETNPDIRRTLAFQLKRELGKAAKRDIELTDRIQAEWRREMPYVPFDLFLILNPGDPGINELLDPLYTTNQLLTVEEAFDQ